jgi:diguanylate cyclase (GGDEF)-like protein/PAS domain S-box-containing protein
MNTAFGDQIDPAEPSWAARLHAALMPDYNAKATTFWWTMVTLGAGIVGGAVHSVAAQPNDVLLQILLGCVIAMLAGIFPVRIPGSKNSFAAGEIFIFLLLLMHGVAGATLAAACEAFVGSARSSKRWTSRLVSPAMAGIAMFVSGSSLQGVLDALRVQGWLGEATLMLTAMLFAAGYFVLNTLFVTLVIRLKRNEPLNLRSLLGSMGWVGIIYGCSALVAALLYMSFQRVGMAVLVAGVPIIAMLLATLHFHFRQREADDSAQRLRIDAAEREAGQAAQHARALEVSERRFHSAFSHAAIGMALVSTDGRALQVNTALCHLLGRSEDDVVGREFSSFLHEGDAGALSQLLLRVVAQDAEAAAIELRCKHPRGHEVWVSMHGGYFSERTSSAPCLILQAQDVTARRDAEARLEHIAYHDALTSLANRVRFSECLTTAIDHAKRDRRHAFALMYLDFDRFKLINDTLGHSAGDQFLVKVAQRIQQQIRPGDIVGRLGGDEFAILIHDLEGESIAVTLAERLQASLAEPCLVDGTEINSSASIGITFSAFGYDTPDEVLRDADIAMYRAKAAGRGRYALFNASLRAQIADQLHLEGDLRRAIERDQLTLAYQPIYDLATGKIGSFEALARWNHPERGPIGPDVFIPIAEEAGLICALTERMLSRACAQLRAWNRIGYGDGTLRMHVNISGTDLCSRTLVSHVTTTLLTNHLEPSQLVLEITESTLMERLDSAIETMTRLRDIGVGLSVDDFGTGYSSLSYLSTLPITSLKIDRSFVQRLEDGTQNLEIVKAIVTLGRSLGKTVIAEGIETLSQLAELRELGGGYGQGYLLARPLTAEMAETLLAPKRVAPNLAHEPVLAAEIGLATLH